MNSRLHKQENSRTKTAAAGGDLPGITSQGEAGSADLLHPPSEDGAQRASEPRPAPLRGHEEAEGSERVSQRCAVGGCVLQGSRKLWGSPHRARARGRAL